MANSPLQPIGRFSAKLRDLGYVEGKNLIVEYRFADARARMAANAAQYIPDFSGAADTARKGDKADRRRQ